MITGTSKLTLVVAVVAVIGGCGGSGGMPLTAASAPTVLGQLKGQIFSNFTQNGVSSPTSNTTLPGTPIDLQSHNGPATMSNLRPLAALPCETVTPAVPVDNDGDNIAAEKLVEFDCGGYSDGTYTYTHKGYYKVKDLDDNDPGAGAYAGLTVEFGITKMNFKELATGNEWRYNGLGNWTYKPVGSSLVSTSNYEGHFGFTSTTVDIDIDYDFKYAFDWQMTPANASNPYNAGTQKFSGSYYFSGTFDQEDNNGNHHRGEGTYSVKYYTKNLEYDSVSCNTVWYKSGSIFVDDSNGNLYEIRFACTSASLYVNGAKSDIWTWQ